MRDYLIVGASWTALGSDSFSGDLTPLKSLSLERLDLTGPLGVDNLLDKVICCWKASLIIRLALGDSQLRVVWYMDPGLEQSTV
jgi:hypothetical protein